MAERVHKYPLQSVDLQVIDMPRFARPLAAQMQHGQLCVWAAVGDGAREPVLFRVAGTGHELGAPVDVNPQWAGVSWRYVGTVQMHHGARVFHVFYAAPWAVG